MNAVHKSLVYGVWGLALLWGGAGCEEEKSNQAPEFVDLDAQKNGISGEQVTENFQVVDPDGDSVTVTMETAPQGASFVFNTFGRFTWVPLPNDAENGGMSHEVVFVATDGNGGRTEARMVVVVDPSTGNTRFTTSNNRVLDLSRTDTLVAPVTVQADSVINVPFMLRNAPEGMEIKQTGPKSGEIRWSPSRAQIRRGLVWGAVVEAGEEESFAQQDLTVTLIPKSGSECPGETRIEHTPLQDQRAGGNYLVAATISAPKPLEVATLFWRMGGDPNDSGGFEGVKMKQEEGDLWTAAIPNPRVSGDPEDIYYFVVAYTGAEEAENCVGRSPAKGLHSFAAFEVGDESCRKDRFEPNDTTGEATFLSEEAEGVTLADGQIEAYGLALCEDDTDVYALNLEERQGASVLITYSSEQGVMYLKGIGPDGETVITESSNSIRDESSMLLPAAEAGQYFVEVSGKPQGFRMYVSIRDDVDPDCVDNQLEPNEFPNSAPVLPEGTYEGLHTCPGDKDFFGVQVPRGFALHAELLFSHSAGDLDLVLIDREGQRVAQSGSSTDNEEILFNNSSPGSSFILEVRNLNGAALPYDLILSLEESEAEPCDPDFFEPNDTADQAQGFPFEDGLESGSVVMCGDDDFYAFHLVVGQSFSAEISSDDNDANLDLEIQDSGRRVVAESLQTGSSESASWVAEEEGIHFVRVFRSGPSGVPRYNLSIVAAGGSEPQECATLDEGEPNDNSGSAVSYPGDSVDAGLCRGDEDWYAIAPEALDTVLVQMEGVGISGGDFFDEVEMDLIGPDGTTVLESAQVFGDFLDMQHTVATGDLHFVRVRHVGDASAGFLYTLDYITF